jgi:twitching motility two-component system response regulator PilH
MKPNEPNRILFVDDDRLILKVLSDFLTFKGFDVVVAENGEEALDKISRLSPDIILLDISMPGIGGIGFLRRIMLSNGALQFPVLVFTARTTTEDYFRGIPIDGFITKPCDKIVLVERINEILEKHKKASLKTILLGEDDLEVADKVVKVFRAAGFVIDEAATGPEVLEKAAVCLPDVVLLKQILTGMNGDVVASILQAMPRTQSIPVVLYDTSIMAKNKEEEEHLQRTTGIRKYLVTQDAVALLNAVKEVVQGPGPVRGT